LVKNSTYWRRQECTKAPRRLIDEVEEVPTTKISAAAAKPIHGRPSACRRHGVDDHKPRIPLPRPSANEPRVGEDVAEVAGDAVERVEPQPHAPERAEDAPAQQAATAQREHRGAAARNQGRRVAEQVQGE